MSTPAGDRPAADPEDERRPNTSGDAGAIDVGPQDRSGGAIDAPAGLRKASRKAARIGKDPSRVRRLLAEAGAKAASSRDRLGDAWHDVQTLFRLLRAWVGGRYRSVPWRVVVLSIAALLYFVNPFDLIPDFLGIGLLDDIGVIGFAMSQMRSDLEAFRQWEAVHGQGDDATDDVTDADAGSRA